MKSFVIGTNYWASCAGTRMWADWNEESVARDLAFLKEHGIDTLRVFPLWSDFQPVKPVYSTGARLYEYRTENDELPDNDGYLDETMLSRFDRFLALCAENGIGVIVALLTGFMSGRLFIPSALYGKNLYTDPVALLFEQKFIKGFVTRFKDNAAVLAWDLGNECDCMAGIGSREAAFSWVYTVTNAIRAADGSRPVVSGMDHLSADGVWTITDQAECVDVLTTHPYPYWVTHGTLHKTDDMKTLLLPTAMNKLHADVGGRISMIEEVGTMGPMVCGDDVAARFADVNLFSAWANGAGGMMWWCAFDQTHLNHAPYTWNKCETKLGMASADYAAKPVLQSFKAFREFLDTSGITLPEAMSDGTVLLTRGQDHWGIGWMTYVLAKMSGVNVSFAYADHAIPDSGIYLMPSVSGNILMDKTYFDRLMQKVADGAALYISNDNAILSEFTRYTGLRVRDSVRKSQSGSFDFQHHPIPFTRDCRYYLEAAGADVLAYADGEAMFTRFSYGKGTVYYLNYPLEKNLLHDAVSPEKTEILLYRQIFGDPGHVLSSDNPFVCITEHPTDDGALAVVINYSAGDYPLGLTVKDGYRIDRCLFGESGHIAPFGSAVFRLVKA